MSREEQQQKIKKSIPAPAGLHPTIEQDDLVSKANGKLRRAFNLFDLDGNGVLSREEYVNFSAFLEPLLRYLPGQGSFQAVDRDRGGTVELEEVWVYLSPLMRQRPELIENLFKLEHVRKKLDEWTTRVLMKPEDVAQWPLPGPEMCVQVNSLTDVFRQFCTVIETANVLSCFEQIRLLSPINSECDRIEWLDKLLAQMGKELCLANKLHQPEYSEKPLKGKCIAVVGAGPCGLRTALELRLLGAIVHVFERRPAFTRRNILKLWDFMTLDLLQLGARELLPRFVAYKDHIGIRELQSLLLKVCLLLGVTVHFGEAGHVQPIMWKEHPPHEIITMSGGRHQFDLLIAADSANSRIGQSIGLPQLPPEGTVQEIRAAVVVNFFNAGREHDLVIEEHHESLLSGEMSDHTFKNIAKKLAHLGINKDFVYLYGETHYFIVAPKVEVLAQSGVVRNARLPLEPGDRSQPGLLDSANIDEEALERYCRAVAIGYTEMATSARAHVEAFWSRRPIVREADGKLSIGIFPFTSPVSKSTAAMKIVNRCPVFLVGDALQQPYWPRGEGIGKGFLGVLDTVYTICCWAQGPSDQELIEWRQALFQLSMGAPNGLRRPSLLPEEGGVPGPTSANYLYTIDPRTRYSEFA